MSSPDDQADSNLPGMWTASDLTGGDPDERSFAERTLGAERFSRNEIERALREADAPEDSMATEDDLLRYEGRAEAVEIFRDMLGIAGQCVSGWCGPWRDGVCVDCGHQRDEGLTDR